MKTQTLLKFTMLVLFLGATFTSHAKTVKGNGNVTKEERKVASFDAIKASAGINVYLFQGDEEKVVVETDENLQECLIVEVDGNVLKCYIDCSIRNSKKMNVYVNFDDLKAIEATSGSDIYGETIIKANTLELDASSGADIKVEVETISLNCDVSSGADITVHGTSDSFEGDASSGADIKARKLTTKKAKASSSSAGDISITVLEEINADASSGGDVNFYGNPDKVYVDESSGGDVNQR